MPTSYERLQELLRQRPDLTQQEKQSATYRFLQGENLDLPPVDDITEAQLEADRARARGRDAQSRHRQWLRESLQGPVKHVAAPAVDAWIQAMLPTAKGVAQALGQHPTADFIKSEAPEVVKMGQAIMPALETIPRTMIGAGRTAEALATGGPAAGEALSAVTGIGQGLVESALKLEATAPGMDAQFQEAEDRVAELRGTYDEFAAAMGMPLSEAASPEETAKDLVAREGRSAEQIAESESKVASVLRWADPFLAEGMVRAGPPLIAGGATALVGGLGLAAGVFRKKMTKAYGAQVIDDMYTKAAKAGFSEDQTSAIMQTLLDSGESSLSSFATILNDKGIRGGAELLGKSEAWASKLQSLLGAKKLSDVLPARLHRRAIQKRLEQQQLVGLLSTDIPRTELRLVGNRQKPLSLLSKQLDATEKAVADKMGLKLIGPVDQVGVLPKGQRRLRVLADVELSEALRQGLKHHPNPNMRSMGGWKRVEGVNSEGEAVVEWVDDFAGDTEAWIKTMVRRDPHALKVLSSGSLASDFAGDVSVELYHGADLIAKQPATGVDATQVARQLMNDMLPEVGLTGEPLSISVVGRKIEDSAAAAGIDVDSLRRVVGTLEGAGLTHFQAMPLANSLMGPMPPEAQTGLIREAARQMKVARPLEHASVDDAEAMLRSTLEGLQESLPEGSRFFTPRVPAGVTAAEVDAGVTAAEAQRLATTGAKHPPTSTPGRTQEFTQRIMASKEGYDAEKAAKQAQAVVDGMDKAQAARLSEATIYRKRAELGAKEQAAWDKVLAARDAGDDVAEQAAWAEREPLVAQLDKLRQQHADAVGATTKLEEELAQTTKAAGLSDVSIWDGPMKNYMAGDEAKVAELVKQGMSPEDAQRSLELMNQPGWEAAEAGLHPTMAEATEGTRHAPDVMEFVRADNELGKIGGVFLRNNPIRRAFRSPQTSVNRQLGQQGEKAAAAYEVSHQERIAFQDWATDHEAALARTLKDPNDRWVAGRIYERDFTAVPKDMLDEVLANETPWAKSVNEYKELLDEGFLAIADHRNLPVERRMRDYFPRYQDHKERVADLMRKGREAELEGRLDDAEKYRAEIMKIGQQRVDRLDAMDWQSVTAPKSVADITERMDKYQDWVKDPQEAFRIASRQAGHYRFMDSVLPVYDKMIEAAGGKLVRVGGGYKVDATNSKYKSVVQALGDSRQMLFSPPDAMSGWVRRRIAMGMARGDFHKPWLNDPEVFTKMEQFARKMGFYLHIGGRASTALVNLITLGTHASLRMRPTSVVKGLGLYLRDQALSGDMLKGVPTIGKHLDLAGTEIGPGVSWMHQLMKESYGSVRTHWFEMAEGGIDDRLMSRIMRGVEDTAGDVLSLLFRSTEGINRGASGYAAGLDAMDVAKTFGKTGKIPDHAFNGITMPYAKVLKRDFQLQEKRLPDLRRAAEAYLDDPKANPLSPQDLHPDDLARLEALSADTTKDGLTKAKEWFRPERELQDAIADGTVLDWAKKKMLAGMQETQFTYATPDRPRLIAEYAPWLNVMTQFWDFQRKELEFLAQRLTPKGVAGFFGMLYAIGGPRAVPFIGWGMEVLPQGIREQVEKGMETLESIPLLGGVAPTFGLSMAMRLRVEPQLPTLPRRAMEYMENMGPVLGTGAILAGMSPAGQPIADAASAIMGAGFRTSEEAERSGLPIGQLAKMGVSIPDEELRSEVDPSTLKIWGAPVGEYMADPGWQGQVVRSLANIPSAAAGGWGSIFEHLGGAADSDFMRRVAGPLATAGEAWKVGLGPESEDGDQKLRLPGDRVAIFSFLRDAIRGAKTAETKTGFRQGMPTVPVAKGGDIAMYTGLPIIAEEQARLALIRTRKKAESTTLSQKAAIHYAMGLTVPNSNGKGQRHMDPEEIVSYLSTKPMNYFSVTREQVENAIMARSKPLVARFVSSIDKAAVYELYKEKNDLREMLHKQVKEASETGNVKMFMSLAETLVKKRHQFYSMMSQDYGRQGIFWPREAQEELVRDLNSTPEVTEFFAPYAKDNPQVADIVKMNSIIVDAFKTGFKQKIRQGMPGPMIDKEMAGLHMAVNTGDEAMLKNYVAARYPGDVAKQAQMMLIGHFLMERFTERKQQDMLDKMRAPAQNR